MHLSMAAAILSKWCRLEPESAQWCREVEPWNQTPAQTPADPINHDDTPCFYSITLLAKIKLITKTNIWTYISIITTTLNDQNHILETCIESALIFFYFDWIPFVYMERAGFMTCTVGDQESTASLKITFQDEWDTPDTHTLTLKCLGSVIFDKTDQNWWYSKDFYINAHEMFKDFFQKHYEKTLPTPTFWTVEYIY